MNQARRSLPYDVSVEPAPQNPNPALASWYVPGQSDAFGDRLLMFDNTTASSLELLRFKPEFGDHPGFEPALRHRVEQLKHFSHPSIAKARRVERLEADNSLALVSNHTPGRRLSELLPQAKGTAFAIELVRQLTPLLAVLQTHGGGMAHGALTPDRIVVTPDGRLVLTEYAMGPALETLHLQNDRLQAEFGIAVPPEGIRTAHPRMDVIQLGVMTLSLLLGRRIHPSEYPEQTARLFDALHESNGHASLASITLRDWLERALQLEERPFGSALDACNALDAWPANLGVSPHHHAHNLYVFPTVIEAADPGAELAEVPALDVEGAPVEEATAPIAEAKVPIAEAKAPVAEAKAPVAEAKAPVAEARTPVAEARATPRPAAAAATVEDAASKTRTNPAPVPLATAMPPPRPEPREPDAVHDVRAARFTPDDHGHTLIPPTERAVEATPREEIPVTSFPSDTNRHVSPPAKASANERAVSAVSEQDLSGMVDAFPSEAAVLEETVAQGTELPRPNRVDRPSLPRAISASAISASTISAPPRWLLVGLSVLVAVETIAIGTLLWTRPAKATAMTIESSQPGAEVLVDGRHAGVTPLQLSVGGPMRSLQILPASVEQPPSPSPAAPGSQGRVEVTSEPAGARVTIDGTRRGVTPFTLALDAGQHTVVISNGPTTTTRTVEVSAGSTASVMASLAAGGTQAGWLSIHVPIELQVREGASLLGTTAADRIMLPAGHHQLELTSPALGFRTTVPVDIAAGQTAATAVAVPNGSLSINAVPWANVWVDGQAVGTTPLGNIAVPIGTHEIIWRHPQLGERRQTATVTTHSAVRVGVDLSH